MTNVMFQIIVQRCVAFEKHTKGEIKGKKKIWFFEGNDNFSNPTKWCCSENAFKHAFIQYGAFSSLSRADSGEYLSNWEINKSSA